MVSKKIEDKTQAEMGLTSISVLLQSISTTGISTNRMLSLIRNDFNNTKEFNLNTKDFRLNLINTLDTLHNKTTELLTNINNTLSDLANYLPDYILEGGQKIDEKNLIGGLTLLIDGFIESIDLQKSINKNLLGCKNILIQTVKHIAKLTKEKLTEKTKPLEDGLPTYKTQFKKIFQGLFVDPLEVEINNLPTTQSLSQQENVDSKSTDNWLKKIYEFLSKTFSDSSEVKSTKSSGVKSGSVKDALFGNIDLTDLASAIVSMKKNLTLKMIKNLDKFSDSVKKLTDIDEKKFDIFKAKMTEFSQIIEGLQKPLRSVSLSFGMLALSVSVLGLAVILPTFTLGLVILSGFLKFLQKTFTGNELTKGMLDFSMGIGILVLSMVVMQIVPFEALLKMIGFIAALSWVLQLNKGGVATDIVKFSMGIGILTVACLLMQVINWESIFKMIVFVGALAAIFIMNRKGGVATDIVKFSMGIGILTVALLVMQFVDWESIGKMLVFVAGLGLILRFFFKEKFGKQNPITAFAMGIGILTLTLWGFSEIDWSYTVFFLGFIATLGFLLTKLYRNVPSKMMQFSFGIGLLVLAIYAMKDIAWQDSLHLVLFIAGIGLATKLFSKSDGMNMLLMGIGIAAITVGLLIFKKSNFGLFDAMIFVGSLLAIGGVMMLFGIPAIAALMGVGMVSMLFLAAGMLVTGLTLGLISAMNIKFDRIIEFVKSLAIIAAGFALLTPLAVLGIVGAVLFLPLALTSVLIAATLAMINLISYDNIDMFCKSIGMIAWTFVKATPGIILGLIGAVLFLPIAVATLAAAMTLSVISSITINEENINTFGRSLNSLVGVINEFGIVSLGKAGIKSLLLLPIIVASTAAAVALKLIGELNISETKVLAFGDTLSKFIDVIATALGSNKEKLEKAGPGIEAIGKLMGIVNSMVQGIQLMANMQFFEYEVRDGKLVVKNVRAMNEGDFIKVGQNIAAMLNCLIEPLTILGSDDDTFVINGVKVPNPFKNKKTKKGIALLGKIGEALLPLIQSIDTYTKLPISTDAGMMQTFNTNLLSLIDTLGNIFIKMETWNVKTAKKGIEQIDKLFDSISSEVDIDKLTSIEKCMSSIMDKLTDDEKWEKINNNLINLKQHFLEVAKAVNTIDLEKALAFEKNLKILVDEKSNENLSAVVEKMTELLGMVKTSQDQVSQVAQASQTTSENVSKIISPKEEKTKSSEKEKSSVFDMMQQALEELKTGISGINSKLSGNLKTIQVKGSGNNI